MSLGAAVLRGVDGLFGDTQSLLIRKLFNMKNPRKEQARRFQQQFHRTHPWRLVDGLCIPHSYPGQCMLSWWGDVGFILSGRRVMVWWEHPRMRYVDEIRKLARELAGAQPNLLMQRIEQPFWKRVGQSRKKVVAYQVGDSSAEERAYFEKIEAAECRLRKEGIDYSVHPHATVRWFSWGIGVELCARMEVRNIQEIQVLAAAAKRLLAGKVTFEEAFPGGSYDRNSWLAEESARANDTSQLRR